MGRAHVFLATLLLQIAGAYMAAAEECAGQTICDTNGLQEKAELSNSLPQSCQKERLQASGGATTGVIKSAENLANAAWRREAFTKYGERFAEIEFMACKKVTCASACCGYRRCTVSGFPCAADMSEQDQAQIKRLETALRNNLPDPRNTTNGTR
jgi:hypothetical protein